MFKSIAIAMCLATISTAALADAKKECGDWKNTPPERLIAACTEVIRTSPRTAWAYGNRGYAYSKIGDYDRAIAEFNKTIELDPTLTEAFFDRGNAYSKKKDYDRAIADYDSAIAREPKVAKYYFNRGLIYRFKGDLDRALANYDKAIAIDPAYASAYNNRGVVFEFMGQFDRALADYREAVQINPKKAVYHFNVAAVSFYSGNPDVALAEANQALEIDSKDADLALWLDIIAARSHAPSRLAEASEKLDMSEWPGPVVRLFLGQLTPEAVLAAADSPDVEKQKHQLCQAHFYLGEYALRQSARDEAERMFKLALSGCPEGDSDEVLGAKMEMKALGPTH